MSDVILEVRNLKKYFKTSRGPLHAVDDISFTLERGKTLGLVGESGCGKSTTGRSILRLIEPTSGEVIFNGVDVTKLSSREMRKMRKDMQIIFQDPFSSLDPKNTVSQIIAEPLRVHKILKNKRDIEDRVLELMETVGLAERLINSYPHELDGGRRQRIGIARALAMEPQLIICDEPVSALDVSIQAQILNLLKELQDQYGLSYIFITHDLSVVNHFSDKIAVMYLGQIVEMAPTDELFDNPLHPYTKALLSAIPVPDLSRKREKISLKGEITSPVNLPEECRFVNRCFEATKHCRDGIPALKEVAPDHFVACFNVGSEIDQVAAAADRGA
ncbi:MAG: ATP-binding cassette domain-containing protein [Bacillota bacterium]|jgi:oligopeptide/dipeptide ABC transporter ATP-binding protein|nr:ATP-binding cassette domain-containing protein [Bacillota bacterium]NLJ03136.1 ATP-binding cassette domain-containing protein [Bacillota bacterium]HKM17241.1 oligopeptide/dipeptide ABC transporter ATP-binding protein [Limnochordia bacterium]